MNVLCWHVHGSWMTAFVAGPWTTLVPTLPGRGPFGGGRPGREGSFSWPERAVEVSPEQCRERDVDVVVVQRAQELDLLPEWVGDRSVPVVFLEHNAPQGRIADLRHPVADRPDLRLVHVTHFNDLFWDAGSTPTTVVEHGIPDPGQRWTGKVEAAAVVVNEPVRRGRVTGTDLLPRFRAAGRVDVFGMGTEPVGGADLGQVALHEEMARRRLYLHPLRWTSLGLSLLEAMHLGMPVVAVGTTEVHEAVPAEVGYVSTDVAVLAEGMRRLLADPAEAAERGAAARKAVLARYGLARFLDDWRAVLEEAVAG